MCIRDRVPWVVQTEHGIRAVAGPDAIELDSPVQLKGADMRHRAAFTVKEGDRTGFRLWWAPSYEDPGRDLDCETALAETLTYWDDWLGRLNKVHGEWELSLIHI